VGTAKSPTIAVGDPVLPLHPQTDDPESPPSSKKARGLTLEEFLEVEDDHFLVLDNEDA